MFMTFTSKISKLIRPLTNMIYSTLSNFFLLASLQLLIMPLIGRSVSPTSFGEISALYSINTVLFLSFGGSLGTLRIVEKNYNGENFVQLAMMTTGLTVLIALPLFIFYGHALSKIDIFIYVLTTGLASYRNYSNAIFRLNLQFNKDFMANLCTCLGYLLGALLFAFNMVSWVVIFLLGELLYLGYLRQFTSILKEKRVVDRNYARIIKEYIPVFCSTLLGSLINNLDRFLLLPLLGPISTAIFFSASSVSKILNFIMTPLGHVLLSQIVASKKKYSKSTIVKLQMMGFIASVCLSFPLFFISKFTMYFLYNKYFLLSENIDLLIAVVVFGTLLLSVSSLLNTFYLFYFNMNLQMIIQVVYCVIYVTISVLFILNWQFTGFIFAYGISSLVRYLLLFFATFVAVPKTDYL